VAIWLRLDKNLTDCHVKYAVTTPPPSKTRKLGAWRNNFTTVLFENTVRKRLYSLGEKFKSFQLSLCGLKKKLQPWKTECEKIGAVEGLRLKVDWWTCLVCCWWMADEEVAENNEVAWGGTAVRTGWTEFCCVRNRLTIADDSNYCSMNGRVL